MVAKKILLQNVKKHIKNAVDNLDLCLDKNVCIEAGKHKQAEKEKIKNLQKELLEICKKI